MLLNNFNQFTCLSQMLVTLSRSLSIIQHSSIDRAIEMVINQLTIVYRLRSHSESNSNNIFYANSVLRFFILCYLLQRICKSCMTYFGSFCCCMCKRQDAITFYKYTHTHIQPHRGSLQRGRAREASRRSGGCRSSDCPRGRA